MHMAAKNYSIFHNALCFLVFFSSSCYAHQVLRKEHGSTHQEVKLHEPETFMRKDTLEPPVKTHVTVNAPGMEAHENETVIVMGTYAMWRAVTLALSLTISLVVCLYWRKGAFVIIKVMIYLLANSTIKGAVKMVDEPQAGVSFKFPLFLTATHFVSGAIVAFAVLLHKSKFNGEKISAPSVKNIGTRFAPISVAFVASIAMNNMALVHSTSAFVEIVGASTPVVTVLMMVLMGESFDMRLFVPCLVVLVGCTLTSNGDPGFSLLGLALAAGSNFPRALKTILSQFLLQKEDGDDKTYSPIEVLAWTCLPASVIIFIWSLCQEGLVPYHQWYLQGFNSNLTLAIIVSCVNATILNTAILFVVKDLGAVGCQLVGQLKSLLVILGGMCVLKEQVSRMEVFGYAMVMIGVYAYNDLESRINAKSEAEKSTEKILIAQSFKAS